MRSVKDETLYQEKRLDLVTENSIDNETKQSLLRIDWSLVRYSLFLSLAKLFRIY